MCGILVAYSSKPINRDRFDAARDTLIHRGPDAQESVFLEDEHLALGHTRLSIIDLSSRANQPMQNGNLWVTFNGEIYNYPELRRQLEAKNCRFTTSSDTEVLLHGYRVWGDGLCERLLGMFAFVIWDDSTKRLFAGRDHLGQKPLYYAQLNDTLVLASEIKAIRAYAKRTLTLRHESVIDALVQDFVAEPDTWYEEISVLPAGHQVLIHRSNSNALNLSIRKYWNFTPDPDCRPIDGKQALERLTAEVEQAVRCHLLADVEVGAFLSGGIDSTCIVTLASQMMDNPVKTYSIGFGANDELPLARDTASRIRSTHREKTISELAFLSSSERALDLFDHPFADTSLVPTDAVSSLAARDLKVVLTGDGGDECFGGYNYGRFLKPSRKHGLNTLLSPSGAKDFANLFLENLLWLAVGRERWSKIMREKLVTVRQLSKKRKQILADPLLKRVSQYDPSLPYQRHRNLKLDPFRDAQWVGLKVPLPNKMLTKVDRCSMAHSLETRAPFLSPRLVEFIFELPRTVTNSEDSPYKGLLIKSLQGKISDRVLHAPKRGFSVPKYWYAVRPEKINSRAELLPLCVAGGLLNSMSWQKLKHSPTALWHFVQLEKALERGFFSV